MPLPPDVELKIARIAKILTVSIGAIIVLWLAAAFVHAIDAGRFFIATILGVMGVIVSLDCVKLLWRSK